jgi:homoserine kinase
MKPCYFRLNFMSHFSSVTVQVPATTANIGPGFDCLGAALTLYNQVKFTITDSPLEIKVSGKEAAGVSTDESNLLYKSLAKLYQHIGQEVPNLLIEIKLEVPLARGLGSSATAIIGGLVGANNLAGNPLSTTELMNLAIQIEGHPDNVVPALLGGCQLSVGSANNWQISEISWHNEIIPILAIPNFELSTEEARKVLPVSYSRSDAIFNIAHLGLLIKGLETNNQDFLKMAMEDKIHQPYRETLIKGYDSVKLAAIEAGAYNMVISGAGPTLLALTARNNAENVVRSMTNAWENEGIIADVRALSLDNQGATILNS